LMGVVDDIVCVDDSERCVSMASGLSMGKN
jgi:hypothetical protein